jgi:dipeptidyl aminopeptidase/acylaminoacyl peptidase
MAQSKRAMTLGDLFRFQRVSDPQVSPDGKWVAYVVTSADLEKNALVSHLWIVPTDGSSAPRQLTAAGKRDRHPRWSPDSKRILFESNRSGENQLWLIELEGGEARQITSISTGAAHGIWSPDGRSIAFVSAVYPEFSDKPYPEANELNRKRIEEIQNNPVKARVFTRLFFRHWDSYVEGKRQHLFVMSFDPAAPAEQQVGQPRDATPGDRDAYPTSSTFETGDNYAFSPDGRYLIFTAVPKENEAWSTNYDLCRVAIDQPAAEWECLTADNPAADSGPVFSPDGKFLAYRAQKRPGYEADKWELMLVPVAPNGAWEGKPRSLTAGLDRSVEAYVWADQGRELVFAVEQAAETALYRVPAANPRPAEWVKGHGTLNSLSIAGDGRTLVCTQATMRQPHEVVLFRLQASEQAQAPLPLTRTNASLLAELDLPRPESVFVPTSDGKRMQMWILKPPGFQADKKWPLAYLVHGGPQAAWEDGWSYRWNPQLWAAQGYVVALPNPRGSTGFGQEFVDEISGDWGGKCFDDLMRGVDYLERLPYIDKDRMAAAGASFGGYMMNWFQGNTTRFKTLITHCSVYNFESMYATTDELWFDEWEHGGPPWGPNPKSYEKHSPHKLARNFKTPMLIIHNDLDFRCPIGEGHQLFTTLQRLGVPSRFINFPDEGHWVLKPRNSEFWHKEVFAWLQKYCPPGGR